MRACWRTAALVAALVACGEEDGRGNRPAQADLLDCGVHESAVLSDSGVGALRIGATVADVRARCMVLLDSTVAGPEGQPERRLTVVTGSVNTAAAVADDRIWRIYVASPRFRTADSLGVGSTVADLRAPTATLAHGEGIFVLRRDHCGLSFELGRGVPERARTLPQVPDSVRVRRVLVVGCRG